MLYSRTSFVARALIIAAAAVALLLGGLSQADADENRMAAEGRTAQAVPGDGPVIQATERISIPYGFDPTLPLSNDGDSIVASGVGACTDGEDITIAFTVTQSTSGATATGAWNGDCTGELQTWTGEATLATSSPTFTGGEAEACASAETRDTGSVTDTQDWCDPVVLTTETVFVPVVRKP